jgi:plastocyanin
VAYPAASRVEVTNAGTQYNFSFPYSGSNPALYAYRGLTIAFKLSVSGHPFQIQSDPAGGSSYSNITVGLVHVSASGAVSTGAAAQLKTSGTLYFTLPYDIAGTDTTVYRYICSIHSSMVNSITPLQGQ